VARVADHLPSGPPADLAGKPVERMAYRWFRAAAWGLARAGSVLALALAWEALARSGAFTPFMLPALSAVLERIWNDLISGDLLLNTAVTLYRALAGFLIGAVAGIALGMAISRNAVAHWFFDPIVSVGFPMPKIAFLPVVMLWLGVYDLSKITMVSVEAVFPVIAATIVGIRGVERELIWSARNMGAGERELLWQIAVPAALPQIITGLQVALPIALIVAIVTEMFMGGYGLGGAMNTASRFADSRGVFAGIVEIAVIGYAMVKLMALARRRLLLWHQEAVAPSTV
jgi:ABC-type nitrate/sulfonate/bicarbonate transport system permease component